MLDFQCHVNSQEKMGSGASCVETATQGSSNMVFTSFFAVLCLQKASLRLKHSILFLRIDFMLSVFGLFTKPVQTCWEFESLFRKAFIGWEVVVVELFFGMCLI